MAFEIDLEGPISPAVTLQLNGMAAGDMERFRKSVPGRVVQLDAGSPPQTPKRPAEPHQHSAPVAALQQ